VLMLITSMGIFGFLSKAHSDQSLISGDAQSKIAIYDEKIKTEKENIEANRRALKQMDESVDQVLGRSTDEKGAEKAVAIRRSQQKERGRLLSEISQSQQLISELNDARAPIAAEVRKVEAEVGPIKYLAAFIYGDNPDTNVLERAVIWVINTIIFVFDPLAVLLLLASQMSFQWYKESKKQEEHAPVVPENTDTNQDLNTVTEPVAETIAEIEPEPVPEQPPIQDVVKEKSILEQHPYLNEPFVHFKDLTPMVYKPQTTKVSINDFVPQPQTLIVDSPEPEVESAEIPDVERPGDYLTPPEQIVPPFNLIGDTHVSIDGKTMSRDVFALEYPELAQQLHEVDGRAVKSSFGTEFPKNARKGELFIKVDSMPNKLFKFNGTKWIEVDKSKTDSYTYNEQYIQYLVEKLKSGEYDIDNLNTREQELVAEILANENGKT